MAPPNAVRRAVRAAILCAGAAALTAGVAAAQQLIGYVKADDADVTGASDVLDGQAVLAGSVGVTAKDHTAVITLGRGGLARVCQTSALHMTETTEAAAGSKASDGGAAPLLFSLDRGAVEIRMNGLANDSIMTPDLRMSVRENGPLDVRLRVARNGDTCVENRGVGAPVLAVTDPFGTSQYELMAGQHVLFEHGSLTEVVDHEAEPCGCPDEKGGSVADALLAPGAPRIGAKTAMPPSSAELHPFPAAVSEGLAPAQGKVADPTQPQATAALAYNGSTPNGDAAANGAAQLVGGTARRNGAMAGPATVAAAPMSAAPASLGAARAGQKEPTKAGADQSANRDLAHIIGHFFRKIFGH